MVGRCFRVCDEAMTLNLKLNLNLMMVRDR